MDEQAVVNTIYLRRPPFPILCLFVTCLGILAPCLRANAAPSTDSLIGASASGTWYPFLDQGKWGFIDATGAWKIRPNFDRCGEIFVHDVVRVWSHDKWGCIDRGGAWVIKPQFTAPGYDFDASGHEVVSTTGGRRAGILDAHGQLILPCDFDEVVLSRDRAWVRQGRRLGVFGFDGKWINHLKTPWPKAYAMPQPVNTSGVAWFEHASPPSSDEQGDWGLITATGQIILTPQLDAHILGHDEIEEWDRPEGEDFVSGAALAYRHDVSVKVRVDGTMTPTPPTDANTIGQPWADGLRETNSPQGLQLIDSGDKVLLTAMEIKPLREGMAIFRVDTPPKYGVVNAHGVVIVPAGIYSQIEDFSEGLAAASRKDGSGYLNKEGHEAIPFTFASTASFSDGMAAVMMHVPPTHDYPWRTLNGYIDKTGKVVIAPAFMAGFWATTPFSRGIAWVAKTGAQPNYPDYAMINSAGKILTDFVYRPPESQTQFFASTPTLDSKRWVGDFTVLVGSGVVNGLKTGGLGLAKNDGQIVTQPQFSFIWQPSDGMIRVDRWKTTSGHKQGFLNSSGTLVIEPTYWAASDFKDGIAWVGEQSPLGRGLEALQFFPIDHAGHHLTSGKYRDAGVFSHPYSENPHPDFTEELPRVGDLLCVADVNGYLAPWPADPHRLDRMSWGYVDMRGQIVAWHKSQ
jgi:WG containing repeat